MFVLLIALALGCGKVGPLSSAFGLAIPGMIVVAPADRPKSVCNRCVIEPFCCVFVLL